MLPKCEWAVMEESRNWNQVDGLSALLTRRTGRVSQICYGSSVGEACVVSHACMVFSFIVMKARTVGRIC